MAENSTTEVLTGGIVLAVAVGFFIYAAQVTGFERDSSGSYALSASFRSVEGVSIGTDVRMAGVRIGSVTGVDLNPQTFRAETSFSIASGIDIPDDSAIAVSSEGLLGGNFVEIIPGGSPFNLEPGGEIIDTQSAVSLLTLLMRFASGSGDAE